MDIPDPSKHRAILEVLGAFGVKDKASERRARVVFDEIWDASTDELPTDQTSDQAKALFRRRIVKGYPKFEAELVLCCLHFVGRAKEGK